MACLTRLAKHLRKAPYVVSLKLIDTAKVPVLKLAMDSDGVLFNVDITVDGQSMPHSGLMAWYAFALGCRCCCAVLRSAFRTRSYGAWVVSWSLQSDDHQVFGHAARVSAAVVRAEAVPT